MRQVRMGGYVHNAVASALVGGSAAVLGGGKFTNGALTGAFSRLFNDLGGAYQRVRSAVNELTASLPVLPQGLVDFSAGVGDGLLLGFGDEIRDYLGIGSVNRGSGAYLSGQVVSYGAGAARVTYAGAAKIGSGLASSGAAASAFRNTLKGQFRLGLFKNYRNVSYSQALSRYGSDTAVRAAAGRTNIYFNAYGAGILGGGAFGD